MTEREAMGTRRPDDAPSEASDLRAEQADAPQPELDRTPAQWPVLVGSGQPLAIAGGDEIDGPVDSAATLASGGRHRLADRVFFFLTAGSGGFVVLLIALVAVFLVSKAVPSIGRDSQSFLFSRGFSVSNGQRAFGVADLLWVTFITSAIAMVLAVPIAVGIALFLTQYAPAPLRRPVAATIDLLAAIPSIIYGIWGIFVLAPELEPVQRVLYHVGFIPLFKDAGVVRGTIFDAGVVLAVMILPIITAIARDVFDRTPAANIEAALALGATKWETIRMAVLPYGRPGVISGAMLGLGRALGETIAVLLILTKPSPSTPFSFSIFAGGQTFASLIGQNMKEAQGPFQTGAYIAAGLVLFVLTFLVNAAARAVVARGTEYS